MASAGRGGKTVPLGNEEPISGDAQSGVMVETAPVTAFKVSQSQLLFQLLVIPFDDPAVFGCFDQSAEPGIQRQRRYPVFTGSGLPARPFDQQPFLGVRPRPPIIPMRRTYANGGKASLQLPACAFTPGDCPEDSGR